MARSFVCFALRYRKQITQFRPSHVTALTVVQLKASTVYYEDLFHQAFLLVYVPLSEGTTP